jgi:hypothetical protein
MTSGASAELYLTTDRKGVLARVGHDLRISVARFELERSGERLHGRFDLRSLRVLGALVRGQLDAAALGASDRVEIERNIAKTLRSDVHPEAVLDGALSMLPATRARFAGQLTLAGHSAPLQAEAELAVESARCRLELTPSRWGIAPFRAFGGALKLEDRVSVELVLSSSPAGLEPAQWPATHAHWSAG